MFLSLLQFFATKFLVLALHLESGSFPKPLSAREEQAAFAALQAGDTAAREKLIRHNLRLVAHIVKKYYALPGDQDDLVSIGTIGLMKAVDTFDPTRRARFSTYASRCIENAILSPAHFQMEKRIHLFHAMTHLRQNGFFGAERAVPFFCFRGCHVRYVRYGNFSPAKRKSSSASHDMWQRRRAFVMESFCFNYSDIRSDLHGVP